MTHEITFPNLGLEFTVNTVAFSIGNFNVYWYGIIIAVGFLLALVYASFSCKKMNIDINRLFDVVIVGLIAGVICARLFYVIFYPGDKYLKNPAEIFREGRAWLFLLSFVLNFMLLSGVSVWLVTYAQSALSLDYDTASLMLTLFFGGALVMRFVSPLIFRVLPVRRYVVWMPVLAAVTLGLGFAIGNVTLLYVLLPLGGFFQGGLIGAMVLISCESFPERSASAAALSSFAVGVSTLATPALMGAVAERFGFTLPMLAISACMLLSALTTHLAIRAGDRRAA